MCMQGRGGLGGIAWLGRLIACGFLDWGANHEIGAEMSCGTAFTIIM